MKQIYNKLVRDKIPDIIESNGSIPRYRKANREELQLYLKSKLYEEIGELFADGIFHKEELADVYEVLEKIMEVNEVNLLEHSVLKVSKNATNGGFDNNYILLSVEDKVENNLD